MKNNYRQTKVTVLNNPFTNTKWIVLYNPVNHKSMGMPCVVNGATTLVAKKALEAVTDENVAVMLNLSSDELKEYYQTWKSYRKKLA